MEYSLDVLVDDVLIQILQVTSVHAVLAVRKTSRRYYLLTKLRCVWYARFHTDVLARNLPAPGPPSPLSLLSATELEERTLRALYLHQAWPRLSANTLVSRQHHGTGPRVDQVVFIFGGTELLTVQGDKVVHWLIVSCPGFSHGLKQIGEWTPSEGVPCRVVKDVDVPGVIAVGPREPLGPHRFSKVVSTSSEAPFVSLCDYAHVPGAVVGIWRHLLLLDTTRELERGGLELLDWHARTTGTALLPCLPDLFGCFLDFEMFAGHLLVVWEHCMSVFPVPQIPVDGQVVVEHKRVFMFQESLNRPVRFTTCTPRRAVPSQRSTTANLQDVDWDWDGQRKRYSPSVSGMLPTLTIVGGSRRSTESVSMAMLVPLVDQEDLEAVSAADTDAFPYRLTHLPSHLPIAWRPENGGREDDQIPSRRCTALCLGSSGRGMFVVGRELRLVSPELIILPPYEMQFGPVLETGKALYLLDRHGQRDVDQMNMDEDTYTDEVDFDEGMGRFVVAKECGGFEVVQLN